MPATGTNAGVLPVRPANGAATGSAPTVFAISKMYFGDTDRAGHTSEAAWKSYGLNIDGKVTGENSTNTCRLVAGASCGTQLDGDDGIDNSFGSNVMPIIQALNSTYSSFANTAIQQGGGTMLFQLDGLGSAPSYARLPSALYRAVPTSQPRWDGTDVRDVDAVSLVGGDISRPIILLLDGYMADRVWVGGLSTGPAYLDLQVTAGPNGGGVPLPPIPLQHIQSAMQVVSGTAANGGTLSGVVRVEDMITWVELWTGTLTTGLCTGTAVMSVVSAFEQASDIMADGTNEPGKPCDGISVGLGFDAVTVQLGKAVTAPPVTNPWCEDAGTDAPSDGPDGG